MLFSLDLLYLSQPFTDHYNEGFKCVVRLVEQFEEQIKSLTLSQKSQFGINHLQNTILIQPDEIKRLSQTIENKSKQLIESRQLIPLRLIKQDKN